MNGIIFSDIESGWVSATGPIGTPYEVLRRTLEENCMKPVLDDDELTHLEISGPNVTLWHMFSPNFF